MAFHDTSLKYDLFPYPLEKVTGMLDIQPDHWECRDFHGSHKGGEIWVNGSAREETRSCVNSYGSGRATAPRPKERVRANA